MNVINFLRAALRSAGSLMDFIFPERCVLCGSFILPGKRAGRYPLCASCGRKLPVPASPRCRLCSRPLISEKDLCMGCRRPAGEKNAEAGQGRGEEEGRYAAGKDFPFENNASLFVYQDPGVTELIVSYKGRKRRSLAAFFAQRLLAEYRRRWDTLPVVPVPCRAASLKKRGFDPIALLCHELKTRGGIKVMRLLRRAGKTREQKTLTREERLRNLRGAIVPASRRLPVLLPEAVVLLDDVFTTGATACACAETLKSMGIQRVYVMTLALD
jgi:ComF family protein